jgi:hypothetical protein
LGVKAYSGEYARIDVNAISRVAASLCARETRYQPSRWDEPLFWNAEGTDFERAQFYALGNAINFRFWELGDDGAISRTHGLIDGQDQAGAMYMWRALKRTLDAGRLPILDANFLANLSREDFERVFADDEGHNPLPAVDERLENLRDLGAHLRAHWRGQFLNLAEAAEGSLLKFTHLSQKYVLSTTLFSSYLCSTRLCSTVQGSVTTATIRFQLLTII